MVNLMLIWKKFLTTVIKTVNWFTGSQNSSLATIPTKSLSLNLPIIIENNEIFIDFGKLDKLNIKGLNNIKFLDTIQLSSDKHVVLESAWKKSNNFYKVIVNPENEEQESIDDFIERIEEEQQEELRELLDNAPKDITDCNCDHHTQELNKPKKVLKLNPLLKNDKKI